MTIRLRGIADREVGVEGEMILGEGLRMTGMGALGILDCGAVIGMIGSVWRIAGGGRIGMRGEEGTIEEGGTIETIEEEETIETIVDVGMTARRKCDDGKKRDGDMTIAMNDNGIEMIEGGNRIGMTDRDPVIGKGLVQIAMKSLPAETKTNTAKKSGINRTTGETIAVGMKSGIVAVQMREDLATETTVDLMNVTIIVTNSGAKNEMMVIIHAGMKIAGIEIQTGENMEHAITNGGMSGTSEIEIENEVIVTKLILINHSRSFPMDR
jgi:hypothetical protein